MYLNIHLPTQFDTLSLEESRTSQSRKTICKNKDVLILEKATAADCVSAA